MPFLHVCPLSKLDDAVDRLGASHVLTLINVGTPVVRPAAVPATNHLFVGMSDIVAEMDGHVVPAESHVAAVIEFARRWDRERPMVVHCFAGVSRSTAAAFSVACALQPDRDERSIAASIRAASPTATPNALLVAIADRLLGRAGRMVEAVAAIGRGRECYEGVAFDLSLDLPARLPPEGSRHPRS